MLSIRDAEKIAKKNAPDGIIKTIVDYKDVFVFLIFFDDPFEGQMDPYYSVNKQSGLFKEFSLFTDGDMKELTDLFLKEVKRG